MNKRPAGEDPTKRALLAGLFMAGLVSIPAIAASPYLLNEGPTLAEPAKSITQTEIPDDSLAYLRLAGLEVFSTAFRKVDGFGDGPGENFADPTKHTGDAGRPTLQNNGTFLRVNGEGAQTCMECHFQASSSVAPFTYGVGGHAGLIATDIIMPTSIDVHDDADVGSASYNGRLANSPDLFGDGGVQLVGEEMTADLQALKQEAMTTEVGHPVELVAKGVDFGSITCTGKESTQDDTTASVFCDTSNVRGVNADLVVRPFGRKGSFSTVRAFDEDAFQFHVGMQPEENYVTRTLYGISVQPDPDGDGINNELTVGQMSALEIFLTTQPTPVETPRAAQAEAGFQLFQSVGCADCHRPYLDTTTRFLAYKLPPNLLPPKTTCDPGQVCPLDTGASTPEAFSVAPASTAPLSPYYQVDLSQNLPAFELNPEGGIRVRMFSDLKRHDMGPGLCESAAFQDEAPQIQAEGDVSSSNFNCMFITAKLWGVFDSAPYMHDGRALTLSQAILMHGGEAQASRNAFANLSTDDKNSILAFLATLRNPVNPNSDVVQPPQPLPK